MNQGTVLNKKTQYYAFCLFYSLSIRCTLPFIHLITLLFFGDKIPAYGDRTAGSSEDALRRMTDALY